MCPGMFEDEDEQIDAFVKGLPVRIQENVSASAPTSMQKASQMAHKLMGQIEGRNKELATGEAKIKEDYCYRETGFDKAIIEAKKIAETIDVELEFPVKRVSCRKKQFDEIPNTEREQQSAKEKFKTDYFLVLVDMALSQLKTRFEQMKQFETIFDSDIDGDDLFRELQSLQKMLPKVAYEGARPWTSLEILEFTKKMDIFSNVLLAYKILLTVPVTVASAEQSFSKLKLLKNYLRSTMTQERLNGLTIINIENRFLSNVDYDKLIEVFASKNARRHHFR
ncbi:uncharacterized protein [Rutidosis leptorrhynchoides]|uniref:uncharacterized protein n=1 Tax=Rutidosis leptorrhynchoides TaxID=125765 RepID=UPI003A99AD65